MVTLEMRVEIAGFRLSKLLSGGRGPNCTGNIKTKHQLYMTSIDDAELVRKLKEVTSGADQAALLSDLGNLHLAEARPVEHFNSIYS